ncbi:MAG TPA: hypothetical protein VLF21_02480 [Candidatus Saccharimonadales bacterium]|nr:hypothetical protein [Candidatus Saccharimonadales bacterium]
MTTHPMLEILCRECGQGFWSTDPEMCPRCSYQEELRKVQTGWSEDGEWLWVEKTRVTATPQAARQFFIDCLAEADGFDPEILAHYPSLLSVSDEVVWWKPAVAPFADPEYQQSIRANPEDPAATAFWEIDVTGAWTNIQPEALAE